MSQEVAASRQSLPKKHKNISKPFFLTQASTKNSILKHSASHNLGGTLQNFTNVSTASLMMTHTMQNTSSIGQSPKTNQVLQRMQSANNIRGIFNTRLQEGGTVSSPIQSMQSVQSLQRSATIGPQTLIKLMPSTTTNKGKNTKLKKILKSNNSTQKSYTQQLQQQQHLLSASLHLSTETFDEEAPEEILLTRGQSNKKLSNHVMYSGRQTRLSQSPEADMSTSSSSSSSSKRLITLHGLKVSQLVTLCAARCRDLQVALTQSQMEAFLQKVKNDCKQRQLVLQEQSLGANSAQALAEIVQNDTHFSRLCLARNNLCDSGVIQLVQAICARTSGGFVHLDISGNNLVAGGVEAVFKLLTLNEQYLISLKIGSRDSYNRNKVTFKSAKVLCYSLLSKPPLEQVLQFLNLQNTSLGVRGLACLVKGLAQNRSLVWLNLATNGLDAAAGDLLAKLIPNTQLQELELSNNELGDGAMPGVADALKPGRFIALRTLHLCNNGITGLGLQTILKQLQRNQYLKALHLDNNYFADEVRFSQISAFLQENASLQTLTLKKCSISGLATQYLAQGLASNHYLQKLVLSGNFVHDDGARALAEVLALEGGDNVASALQTLELVRCGIEDAGGEAIARALLRNEIATNIDLRHNLLAEGAGQSFIELLKSNKKLQFLHLEKNLLRTDQFTEIYTLLRFNLSVLREKQYPALLRQMNELHNFGVQEEQRAAHAEQEILRIEDKIYQEKIRCTEALNKQESKLENVRKELQKLNESAINHEKQQTIGLYAQQQEQKQLTINADVQVREIAVARDELRRVREDMQRKRLAWAQTEAQQRTRLLDVQQQVKQVMMAYESFFKNTQQMRERIEGFEQLSSDRNEKAEEEAIQNKDQIINQQQQQTSLKKIAKKKKKSKKQR